MNTATFCSLQLWFFLKIKIKLINLAHRIGLFDLVFDLGSLFNRYQRPMYSGGGGFYQGGSYPGGFGSYGGYQPGYGGGSYGNSFGGSGFGGGYPGSGLGTNILGNSITFISLKHLKIVLVGRLSNSIQLEFDLFIYLIILSNSNDFIDHTKRIVVSFRRRVRRWCWRRRWHRIQQRLRRIWRLWR